MNSYNSVDRTFMKQSDYISQKKTSFSAETEKV